MDDFRPVFKLRDLMITIAVIAVGLAIFRPDRYPHYGRRTQCINNMRQIGIGLQGYVNAHGQYPNAGTFGERPEAYPRPDRPSFDARESIIYRMLNDPAEFAKRSPVPSGNGVQVGPLYSWVVDVLPYMDQTSLYNQYDKRRVYDCPTPNVPGRLSNREVAVIDISTLRCSEDDTFVFGGSNLSYVVNGGFSRWPGWSTWSARTKRFEGVLPPGLEGTAKGVTLGYGKPLDWGSDIARRTGVMFLGTAQGDTPWDVRTTPKDITDGTSTTALLSENTLAGYAAAGTNPYAGGAETNWAAPLPNSVMFYGSDDVCGGFGHNHPGSGRCREDQGLAPVISGMSGKVLTTGPSWADANRPGAVEGINGSYAQGITIEGGAPFPSSGHPGGVVVLMCDGSARFVKDTIDGSVWARLLTPAGGHLVGPPGSGIDFRQGTVTDDGSW